MTRHFSARGAVVLRAVIAGKTLKEAGERLGGVSSTTARHLLSRICRELELSDSVEDIRRDKGPYLAKLGTDEEFVAIGLNQRVAASVLAALKLQTLDQMTPKYLSNITAAQLLGEKCTVTAVADVQDWLLQSGVSLKRTPPRSEPELQAVRRAICLLDGFHFDTSTIREQYKHLVEVDSQ